MNAKTSNIKRSLIIIVTVSQELNLQRMMGTQGSVENCSETGEQTIKPESINSKAGSF